MIYGALTAGRGEGGAKWALRSQTIYLPVLRTHSWRHELWVQRPGVVRAFPEAWPDHQKPPRSLCRPGNTRAPVWTQTPGLTYGFT